MKNEVRESLEKALEQWGYRKPALATNEATGGHRAEIDKLVNAITLTLALLKQPTSGDCPYKPEPNPDREKREIRTEPTGEVDLQAEKGMADMGFVSTGARKEIDQLQADLAEAKKFHENYEERSRGYVRTIEAELTAAKEMHANAKEAMGKLQLQLKVTKEEWQNDIDEAKRLQGEVKGLKKFARHKKDCMLFSITEHPHCTCGYKKEIGQALRQKGE